MYTMITGDDNMNKKTEVITLRTQEWVKNGIEEAAKQNGWSTAKTTEEIIKNFLINPQPGTITIRVKDLEELLKEAQTENPNGAIELQIEIEENEEENKLEKILSFSTLSAGGLVCYMHDTVFKDLTNEELLDIE